MEDVRALRRRMRAQRAALGAQEQARAAQAVFGHLRELRAYKEARCVMAYAAARGELSVEAAMRDVLASGRVLALPLCEGPGVMSARRVDGLSQLRRGAYGILEPDASCARIEPDGIDLAIVPGTAFDCLGHRIGQGGGYYDRFLPGTRALRVGVCHGFALLGVVPTAAHDAGMDAVITPDGVIFTPEKRQKLRQEEPT